ncbi:hypothetical protein N1851_030169 [Merluccius polli]|uniref:Uncharacterized protein n=1 Tax=Merluccius polli TaxID=89951 RepID=A0AA47M627_MERPO|nr:hypothetical protein N1851_030169 [Merluccius polli]
MVERVNGTFKKLTFPRNRVQSQRTNHQPGWRKVTRCTRECAGDSGAPRPDQAVVPDFLEFAFFPGTQTPQDQKARTVAKALWENFIFHYGTLSHQRTLHTDGS